MTQTPTPTVDQPTAAQNAAAFAGPAPLVNRFVLVGNGANVRLAFMEDDTNGDPHLRAAVSMPAQDAYNMAQAILSMFANTPVPPGPQVGKLF